MTLDLKVYSQNVEPNILKGLYFGQQPPGNMPEMFAPKLFNFRNGYHSPIVFSPDGKEAFWSLNSGDNYKTFTSNYHNGEWSNFKEGNFNLNGGVREPTFSVDGKRLYFLSTHLPEIDSQKRERIWYVEKRNSIWSEAKVIDKTVYNHPTHWSFSVSNNSNIFFTSRKDGVRGFQDIYMTSYNKDLNLYEEPIDLGEIINTSDDEFTPFIAPDENYIIFTQWKSENKKSILHISFKQKNGSWAKSVDLGEKINLGIDNICPKVSADGKYLFFLSDLRMFWVNTNFIEDLRPKS